MTEPVSWDAGSYETVSDVQLRWGRALLDRRTWRGDEVVLDAGCGPGNLTEELLARVPRGHVIAVDVDVSMVERAAQRLKRHGARVKVLKADLASLTGIEPVDVIFSNAVLHWVRDHDAVFEAFLKHLKAGGELLIQCGGEGNLQHVRAIAAQLIADPAFARHFSDWRSPWRYEDDASTQERLFIAGYVDPKVSLEPAPTTFPDAKTFEAFLRGVVLRPYLQRLAGPELQNRFVASFMERARSDGLASTLDYVRLNIRARRPPHGS